MAVYIFPGQGSQAVGMGKDTFDSSDQAKDLFNKANEILGFDIMSIMFEGSEEQLKETKVTQPAIFINSVVRFMTANIDPKPTAVAGHSLGELSALVANQSLDFKDALLLVQERALAMQEACDLTQGTMAAVLGMEDADVEKLSGEIEDVVVAANYNCPGQLVISGSLEGVEKLSAACTEAGARRVVPLKVGGAFHSPLMQPARERLARKIESTEFKIPIYPIYQNFDAQAHKDPVQIKQNLIEQLTAPVKWRQSVMQMIADGEQSFIEVGGRVLSSLVKKTDRSTEIMSI